VLEERLLANKTELGGMEAELHRAGLPAEVARFRGLVGDTERLTALLHCLAGRLARCAVIAPREHLE
jgi:hypothetical protein